MQVIVVNILSYPSNIYRKKNKEKSKKKRRGLCGCQKKAMCVMYGCVDDNAFEGWAGYVHAFGNYRFWLMALDVCESNDIRIIMSGFVKKKLRFDRSINRFVKKKQKSSRR